MTGIDLEDAFYLFAAIWSALWTALWVGGRRWRGIPLPAYASKTAIALPGLAGAAVTGIGMCGLETYGHSRTFTIVRILGGLWPLVMGLLTWLCLESLYLWVCGQEARPGNKGAPPRTAAQAIKERILPIRPASYVVLAALTIALFACLMWPDAVDRVISNEIFSVATYSVFAALAIVVMVVLRRRPPSGALRQVAPHMPKVVFCTVALAGLAWLWFLAVRLGWDERVLLGLAGLQMLAFYGILIVVWVFAIRRQLVRRRPRLGSERI